MVVFRLYLIVHWQSGRVYIGQTNKSVSKRWARHCQPIADCPHLHNAIQKYGPDAFRVFELMQVPTKERAAMLERVLIAEHDATNPKCGFNIALGGLGWAKSECSRGHSLLSANAQTPCGHCRECERMRSRVRNKQRQMHPPNIVSPECSRGHDRTLDGALTREGRCVVCERERAQRRRKVA